MDVQTALRSQYHAGLAMLREAIETCPDDLWTAEVQPPFWRIAWHSLFFTHLYLMRRHEDFRPWPNDRQHAEDLDGAPMVPFTKAETLEYWEYCGRLVDERVPTLDLSAPTCGFPWYDPMPKLDHQLNNIRHIQHHTAVLSDRLRRAGGAGVEWVGQVGR